eukprot:s1120_g4.t1
MNLFSVICRKPFLFRSRFHGCLDCVDCRWISTIAKCHVWKAKQKRWRSKATSPRRAHARERTCKSCSNSSVRLWPLARALAQPHARQMKVYSWARRLITRTRKRAVPAEVLWGAGRILLGALPTPASLRPRRFTAAGAPEPCAACAAMFGVGHHVRTILDFVSEDLED